MWLWKKLISQIGRDLKMTFYSYMVEFSSGGYSHTGAGIVKFLFWDIP